MLSNFFTQKAFLLGTVLAVFCAACGPDDSTETFQDVPETLEYAEEDESTSSTAAKTSSTSTTAPAKATSTTATPNTSVSVATSNTTTSFAGCSTPDYQITIPAGWNTATSGDLACVAFIKDTFPASLECDCTLSVKIEALAMTAANKSAELQNSSAGNWNSSSVLGGTAELITGDWDLSEVQTGSSGQTAMRYMYLFDDGPNSILVTADEFHDFGGTYSFADRKAAVDALASDLIIT